MKRTLSTLFIALATLMTFESCSNCGGKIFGSTSEDSGTVYVTEYGKRYHREDCYTIQPPRHHPYAVSRSEAIAEGRSACKICWP